MFFENIQGERDDVYICYLYLISSLTLIFRPYKLFFIKHTSKFLYFYASITYSSFRTLFYNHEIFIKLNLPIFIVLVRHRKKSQKYFDLSALNWNFNNSNR